MQKTILLVAGGTGGHFFPALALAEELDQNKKLKVILVTDNRCKKYLTNNLKIESHIIDLYINRTGLYNKLKMPFSILFALIKSLLFLFFTKPSLVMGFGGYPSFPTMFMAQILRLPTIIHEQNSYLGASNKFLAKKANIVSLAYENTKNLPFKYLKKTIIVGDLVRKNIKTLKNKKTFNNDNLFCLLVIGGSQGAKFFAQLIPKAIEILLKKHPEIKLKIIQQVTIKDQENVSNIYRKLDIKYEISDFFHNISKSYKEANLVIARSGATTIAELTQIGLPAIFIPFPFASNDHQYYNAKNLEEIGASWCFKQKDITAVILANKLHDLINNPAQLNEASIKLQTRKNDASKTLLDTIFKIIT